MYPFGNPTVTATANFNAVTDAQILRKAMKGFGTDESAIINVLCRRSNQQIQEIAKAFKTNFGKDLIEDIKSETSGNFEALLVARLTPIVDFYVKELHDAIAGIGTDEDVLIEVLCSLSNYEIQVICDCYQRTYCKSLESDLMADTSGNFKRLMVSLCTAHRDESGVVDPEAARRDATELLRAGELRVGTDESTFNLIFCQRNYQQLKLIFGEYKNISGHSIEKAIEKEFSGDIKDGLLAIVKCVCSKSEFFAARLCKSMKGMGTNDRQLIRLIVTRCEIDMRDIKDAFQRLYGDSLRNWIKGDTSGHYKHALYVLIGEEKS
uniref:Annexin n=1 Tax=Corethrella appendiculata TaxID=1370023 RepID=U5EWZ9_9DIPT